MLTLFKFPFLTILLMMAGLPAVANKLAVPLATAMRRGDFPMDFPAVANGIAVSLATAFFWYFKRFFGD